jgi:hypothetical protein
MGDALMALNAGFIVGCGLQFHFLPGIITLLVKRHSFVAMTGPTFA